jgi:hypothetical protein
MGTRPGLTLRAKFRTLRTPHQNGSHQNIVKPRQSYRVTPEEIHTNSARPVASSSTTSPLHEAQSVQGTLKHSWDS